MKLIKSKTCSDSHMRNCDKTQSSFTILSVRLNFTAAKKLRVQIKGCLTGSPNPVPVPTPRVCISTQIALRVLMTSLGAPWSALNLSTQSSIWMHSKLTGPARGHSNPSTVSRYLDKSVFVARKSSRIPFYNINNPKLLFPV